MIVIEKPKKENWSKLLRRPTQTVDDIQDTVQLIFDDIKRNGDLAINKYTYMFDGVEIDQMRVDSEEINAASKRISKELKAAISIAKSNITKFHSAQKTNKLKVETIEGVVCWQEKRAINKVGLYIPGGTAPLFSTVLMLAIPASIAGCENIVLCTPPNKDGLVADEILYTAQLCGVSKIFKVGGIQAIAALTYGSNSIPQVYKIFVPGNQYVTVAKQLATNYGVAIDMPAGPSELLIFADNSANECFIASDLLSQAEHGKDSQVVLISTSRRLIDKVNIEIQRQIVSLPRKDIANEAILNSKCIYVESDEIAIELINEYGPEHFIICSTNEDYFVNNIQNAGSVFIGNYTPESAGDYASGTNHTLPTNGYSKAYSGVNLDSFQKSMTFQKISQKGIAAIGPSIELMAEAEGLRAHKNAISMRLKDLKNK